MSRRALTRLAVVAAIVLLIAGYFAIPPSADLDADALVAKGKAFDVEIVRDAEGVPHIFGERDVDVAYGLGFAQSEDDFATVQDIVLAMRGRLATVKGPEAGPTDYLVGLFDVWGTVERRYDTDLDDATRALADAYADGVNHYAALHPEEVLPGVVPMTGRDVVAGFVFKMPFFYGLDRTLKRLFAGPQNPTAFLAPEVASPEFGSNGFAVTSTRSGDGKVHLVVNSHQPYTGPVAWYEAHLKSREGWEMYGGTFPGAPVILHGVGPRLGWASTVNVPDLVDVYALELNPEDPMQYRHDGGWKTFEQRTIPIRVKVYGRLFWTVEKTALSTVHGPVVETNHGKFAIRYAGRDDVRHLAQYYRMNRAQDFDAWRDAMRMLAIPCINFVYADAAGNVGHFYNGQFPKRKEGVDWADTLPGADPSLVWTEYLPFDALPHTVNPPSGFVFSANHSPYFTTDGAGAPKAEDFSPTLGVETRLTNRARRVLELAPGQALDRKTLERIKYDKRYHPESDMMTEVKALCTATGGDDELLTSARKVLCAWDGSAEADSQQAALAITTVEPILMARREGRLPPEGQSLLLLNARILMRVHERLEIAWDLVNKIRRGARSFGLGGGPDTLRAVHGGGLEDDGTRTANLGDTLIVFASWDAEGWSADAIHQFGSATTRPRSKHFADQLQRFAEEQLRTVPLDEAAIRAVATRTYRP